MKLLMICAANVQKIAAEFCRFGRGRKEVEDLKNLKIWDCRILWQCHQRRFVPFSIASVVLAALVTILWTAVPLGESDSGFFQKSLK